MNVKTKDKIATVIFYLIAFLIVCVLAGLLGYILVKGLPEISWKFLSTPPQSFQAGGGIAPEIWNSFYMLVITMIISVPIAIGAGIYMSEYAKQNWITDFVRTMIEVLSSLPSIVVGLFGFLVFVIQMGWSFSVLSGALTLTIFNLPLLIRVVEDALRSIPDAQREAGLALGLSRWETITRVLVPAALPAIITGVILGAGRVFGEAAALIFTAGQSTPILDFANWNPFSATSPLNIFRPAETLAVHIWKINGEGVMPDAAAVSDGASAVLILSVLIFNILARIVGRILYKRMTSA
ncbi:Phosphate transport system permease protein pstA [Listeria grayi]|uniref:Phosphate transport system permease protein PstA n=2 Tax=Listeria grayi TaxID=1641 RepID=A0A829R7L5_LISGR|nr:phosphate ABC transporter permease PstA [Listeria grayi]EGT1905216.1 phosphate ABC transporter permease PstA [Listeria monocytogenes]EUJ28301.1 phosphate ABC transporter permease [Listeria grayi FSL F6-1183]MBC1922583.1 phosphate ABC transporter permease PstA [Listeria grayi]STY44399.1 Phosphate transport system permease protein pstA [Listeria grayi]VEI36305.1 Phosphate transport system permease protein pstA [Listeria grayi]